MYSPKSNRRPSTSRTAQTRSSGLKCVDGFNTVDLVCAVRDVEGRRFDLGEYIDQDTAIVTEKSVRGRDVKALERPGLWNGAMAGWNTVFVEVPLATFSPVKSVLDLLRKEHASPSTTSSEPGR